MAPMDAETEKRALQNLLAMLRTKPAKPIEGRAAAQGGGRKEPENKPKQPTPTEASAKPEAKKATITSQDVQRVILHEAARADTLPTTADKMRLFLHDDIAAHIENPALVGCISSLKNLDWREPSFDTWHSAVTVLSRSYTTPLEGNDAIIYGEVRLAVGEYYLRNKAVIDAQWRQHPDVVIPKDTQEKILTGVEERMKNDKFLFETEKQFYAHMATSKEPENTPAWAKDIEKQILEEDKNPPEVHFTVSFEDATRKLEETARDDGIVKPGEHVTNREAAQILYETVTAPADAQAAKEFWLVKGNQLKFVERADMPRDELDELRRYRDRFKEKALEGYRKDLKALEDRKITLDRIEHELSGFESGMARRFNLSEYTADDVFWDKDNNNDNLHPDKDATDKKIADRLESFRAKHTGKVLGAFDRELLQLMGDLVDEFGNDVFDKKLPELRGRVMAYYNEMFLTNTERFSTMFFEWADMKRVFANPDLALQKLVDEYAKFARLFPSRFQQAVDMAQGRMVDFFNSSIFQGKLKEYYENYNNWNSISDFLDDNHKLRIEDLGREKNIDKDEHGGYKRDKLDKWISEHKDEFKKWISDHNQVYRTASDEEAWEKYYRTLVGDFTMSDTFQKVDVAFRGNDLARLQEMRFEAGIGEHGELDFLSGRNGFNFEVYQIMDRKGNFRGAQNDDGKEVFMDGVAHQRVKDLTKRELLDNKNIYYPKLVEKYGIKYSYEEAVDRTVDEMYSLHVMSARAILWSRRGIQLYLGANQCGVANEWAGVGPDEKIGQALMPLTRFLMRWHSDDPATRWSIEEMTTNDEGRIRAHEYWEKRIDDIHKNPDSDARGKDIMELEKRIFAISEGDFPSCEQLIKDHPILLKLERLAPNDPEYEKLLDPKAKGHNKEIIDLVEKNPELTGPTHEHYKSIVKQNLKRFFPHDHETGEELVKPPATLQDVARDELLRAAVFRTTLETTTDPEFLHTYTPRETSWQRNPKIDLLDEKYRRKSSETDKDIVTNYREIALHERACKDVSDLFDYEQTHAKFEKLREDIVLRDDANPQKEGILVTMDRCSPAYSIDALRQYGYLEADKMLAQNTGVLDVFPQKANGAWNIMEDQLLMREELCNKAIAERPDIEEKRIFRVNYTKFNENDPNGFFGYTREEYEVFDGVFQKLKDGSKDPEVRKGEIKNWLKAGNTLSNWLLEEKQLQAISEPVNAAYFRTIHAQDRRVFTKMDKAKYARMVSLSASMYHTGVGWVRHLGDMLNVQQIVAPELPFVFRAIKQEDFEMHRDKVVSTTEWTGAHPASAKLMLDLTAAWNRRTAMDMGAQLLGATGEHPWTPISIDQRLRSKGGLARGANDVEESWHRADAKVGGKMTKLFPEIAEKVERKSGFIAAEIRWPKPLRNFGEFLFEKKGWKYPAKIFNAKFSVKTAWLPRFWAIGLLIAAGVIVGGAQSAKKGASQASGGGGGGGGSQEG